MKKILLYGFIALVVINLLSRLWTSITLDEEEEVLKFIQKIEMLKSSDDYYDISNSSYKYLDFLEENIDWFSPEQSKELSKDLNSLRSFARSKIDSIDQSREQIKKKEEDERKKKEEDERKKKEEEERKNKKSEIKNNVKKNDISYRSCGWCGDSFVKGNGYNTVMRMINKPDTDFSYYCSRKCATDFLKSTR
jgi:ribosomal protein L24E